MSSPHVTSTNRPKKKGFISEGEVALLLRRYTASTLLAILQEVANSSESKLNWTGLLKNTNTGIKNAREYQALWRHLAYRTSIADSFEDEAEPLDDDSDLEFEVEPLPGVSPEVAADVSACVKVLAASGTPGNAASKNSETCFTIDIPNSSSGWEVKGNGQISNVVIQGNSLAEAQPVRKKRKRWTPEEDQELVAAVEKCGEGNWATILKGAFKHDRTAAQLSQRWALIRKRRENQTGISQNIVGDGPAGNVTGVSMPVPLSILADGQRLVTPGVGTTVSAAAAVTGLSSTPAALPNAAPSLEPNISRVANLPSTSTLPPLAGKARAPVKKVGNQQGRLGSATPSMAASLAAQPAPVGQSKSASPAAISAPNVNTVSGCYTVVSGVRNNSPTTFGARAPLKGPDPMVQAAAVAAGARIAPASAAASLLKAAQSGNVVHHIGPGGVPMGKPGIPNQAGSSPGPSSLKVGGAAARNPPGTTPFVHYIRTATASQQSLLLNSQRASQMKVQPIRASSTQLTTVPLRPSGAVSASGLPGPSQKPVSQSSAVTLGVKPVSKPPGESSSSAIADYSGKASESGEGVSGVDSSKLGTAVSQVDRKKEASKPDVQEESKPADVHLSGRSSEKETTLDIGLEAEDL